MTDTPKASNDLEVALWAAVERGDIESYLHTLRHATVVIPAAPDSLTSDTNGWPGADVGGERHVPVFTSRDALVMEPQLRNVPVWEVPLSELAKIWPDPSWRLAVNPGLPSAVTVPGSYALSTGVRLGAVDPREVLGFPDINQDGFAEVRTGTLVTHNETEKALLAAIVGADAEGALRSLLAATLFIVSTEKDGFTAPGQAGFRWIVFGLQQGDAVPVFTSRERLEESMGHRAQKYTVLPTSLEAVSEAWPDSDTALVVNPSTPLSVRLPGPGAMGITDLAEKLGLNAASSDFQPGAAPDDAKLDSAAVSLALYYQSGATLSTNDDGEKQLLEVAATGDRKAFLTTLFSVTDQLRLAMDAGTDPGERFGGQDMPWHTRKVGDRTVVPVFTTVGRQNEVLGRAVGSRSSATLENLLRYWPNTGWDLALNPGTPIGALLPGDQIWALSEWRDQAIAHYLAHNFPVTERIDMQLYDAARRGDRRGFLEILRTARVWLRHPDKGLDRKITPTDPSYPWKPASVRGRPSVVVHSTTYWQSSSGSGSNSMVKFGELVAVWPASDPDLVLNPGTPISITMTADEVRAFAASQA